MKNSGNEAKKSLKTKDRSRNLRAKLHQLEAENEQEPRNLRKKTNIPALQNKVGRVTHCRLQQSRVTPAEMTTDGNNGLGSRQSITIPHHGV